MDTDQLHDLGYLFACKIGREFAYDDFCDEDLIEPAEHFVSVMESLGIQEIPNAAWFIADFNENWKD